MFDMTEEKNALDVTGSVYSSEEERIRRTTFRDTGFFWAIFLSIVFAFGATFVRMFVTENYFVIVSAPCDPSVSSCFVLKACDTENGSCGADDVPTVSYFKHVKRKAFALREMCPNGTSEGSFCAELDLSCRPDEIDRDVCRDEYCFEDTLLEGESCAKPGATLDEISEKGEAETIEVEVVGESIESSAEAGVANSESE